MPEVAIRCRHISKFFGEKNEVKALQGVDLTIDQGEFLMLVGPSGCGKTTLISIIAGILQADEGACEVFGKDYAKMSARENLDFRAKNIGFVFQAFNLLPSLTIAENVSIPLVIAGESRQEALKCAEAMLKEVGLGERTKSFPSQLSGGQQQRVAIARAMVHSPRLLVCDEPTSALDHETGMKVIEIMQSLQRKIGTTFVIVTHDNRIFDYADRIVHMDDGMIVTPEEASI